MALMFPDMNSEDKQKRIKATTQFLESNNVGRMDKIEEISLTLEECEYEDVIFELLKEVAELNCSLAISGDMDKSIRRAIGNISDQSKLIELANISPCTDEIIFAVIVTEYINDEKTLADLVKRVKFGWVDVNLIDGANITDKDLLIDIAKNARETLIGKSAVDSLNDIAEEENSSDDFEEIFADIAKNTTDYEVAIKALEFINDIGMLEDIAKNAINEEIRKEADYLIFIS